MKELIKAELLRIVQRIIVHHGGEICSPTDGEEYVKELLNKFKMEVREV